MLKEYPQYKRGDTERFYSSLSLSEQKTIDDFLSFKATTIKSKGRLQDAKRNILQFRQVVEKPLTELTNQDVIGYLGILNNSKLRNNSRNNLKADVQRFLQKNYKDWSIRFDNLEDIKFSSKGIRNHRINSQTRLSKEDIEKLINECSDTFLKTFMLVQSEAGLRTQETRFLKWSDISFNINGELSELRIDATKTETERYPQVNKATKWLKMLKAGSSSPYVFPALRNPNTPIDKGYISKHIRLMSKKILGREIFAYMFRHETSTRLIAKVLGGKLPAPTYEKFMGHSFKQGLKAYNQLTNEEDKEIFKKNMFELDVEDLPEAKKNEYEEKIKQQDSKLEAQSKDIEFLKEQIKEILSNQNKKIADITEEAKNWNTELDKKLLERVKVIEDVEGKEYLVVQKTKKKGG